MKKALFLHLSDIHLESNTPIDKISDLIIKSLAKIQYDTISRVFLLFTGDMTKASQKDQFLVFKKFFGQVKRGLEDRFGIEIRCFIVPGNHDIELKNRVYPLDELIKSTIEEKDSFVNKEMTHMNDALEVCKAFNNFENNDMLSIETIETENIRYRFISINSAPLSAMEKEDKGQHHLMSDINLPHDSLFGKKTISILLMHHRPDWFDEESLTMLDTYIADEISIAFFGHEHNPTYKVIENNGRKVMVDGGGELISKKETSSGTFSYSLLDEESLLLERAVFKFNIKSNTFTPVEPIIVKIATNEILPIKSGYLEAFYKSPLQKEEGSLLDVFVMPSITTGDDGFEISSIEKVVEKIEQTRLFVIEGSTKAGKTTFLKATFNECQKRGPCIFITITSPTNDNARKIVSDAFDEMYGNNPENTEIYNSFDINRKYVFVDNFDVLKTIEIKKKVLSYLKEHFGYVIISNSKNESPKESIKELGLFEKENVYRNYGITARGRKELVKKICAIKNVAEEYVENISNLFERQINGVSLLDFTDPSQGIMLIESIIDEKLYFERNTENQTFTERFRHYLGNLLAKAGGEERLDSYLIVLSTLAFNLWRKDVITFCEADIMEAHSYCRDEGRCEIQYRAFQKVALESGIIYEYSENKYRFKRNSYLSYFAAQEIIRLMAQDDTDYLNELANKITHGLNSDIFLFILFYTKQIKPLKYLKEMIDKNFTDVKILDFNDTKSILFSTSTSLIEEAEENKLSKKERLNKRDRKEKQGIVKAEEDETKQISRSPENEESERVIATVKSVEIISKAIAGFPSLIKREVRQSYFESCFNAILRMISHYFSFTNEEIEELENEYAEYKEKRLSELQSEGKNNKEIEMLNNSSIRNFLFGALIEVLTLYESLFAYLVVSKQTIQIIKELNSERFENCVFKLYSFIFANRYDDFIEELKYAKNTFPANKINNLVHFFARIYIVHNSFTSAQFDKICSVAGIKKTKLLPYASREDKIKQ